MSERVVITAVGAVTPVGLNAAESLEAVFRGRSGIRRLEEVDVGDLDVRIGGEVRGFDPTAIIPRGEARRLDTYAHYAIAAGFEALDATGTDLPAQADRMSVTVGTSAGPVTLIQEGARTIDARGPARVQPGVVVYGGSDSAAAYLSVARGITGPSLGIGATCASGAMALGEAMRAIRHGYLDAALVIGADHCLNRVNLAANANIRALTRNFNDDPSGASRPFDRARSGFVMSSGAAAVVLEGFEHARGRGARILGEVLGYGVTSDAYHATAPHPGGDGAARAMRAALADARLEPSGIDVINAHATSTPQGDAAEAAAIFAVFGEATPAVTATKSVTGHLLGASGVFEAIVGIETLQRQMIPPTINLDEPDTDLDVVTEPRVTDVRTVLSNSFGFGGHNACLILGAAPAT